MYDVSDGLVHLGACMRTAWPSFSSRSAWNGPVTTGLIGGLDIEVTGLNDGTPVVTGPFQALRELKDGQAVRIQAPR